MHQNVPIEDCEDGGVCAGAGGDAGQLGVYRSLLLATGAEQVREVFIISSWL